LEAARLGIDILADPLALVPDEGEDMNIRRNAVEHSWNLDIRIEI